MMKSKIVVSAPSRIHFGLFSVGDIVPRQFGGLGLMIKNPRTQIEFVPSSEFEIDIADSELNQRCRDFASSWFQHFGHSILELDELEQLPVSIQILSQSPAHVGLGSGTQLALATATGLNSFFEAPALSPEEMAAILNRGKRSAIGTYGFYQGGFLIDRGKSREDRLSPLDLRLEFPANWRVVLTTPNDQRGLSGTVELDAFDRIPPSTDADRNRLIEIARDRIVPGLTQNDFAAFAEGIYEIGRRSGMHFESVQGGPYNGSEIAQLIDRIRELGFAAVGQSSWGPTVYTIVDSPEAARRLVDSLSGAVAADFLITAADNVGFQMMANDNGRPASIRTTNC